MRSYLKSAESDAAFQLALQGADLGQGVGISAQKGEFRAIVPRIIERVIADGAVRDDLSVADFPLIACGVMATMYYKPMGAEDDWRRHLDLALGGIRITEH